MTIQISIIIWTVICFCLLCIILKHLLFAPILDVLDKRNQRIQDAREKKQRDTIGLSQIIAQREQEFVEQQQAQQLKAEDMVAAKQQWSDEMIEKMKLEEQEMIESYKETILEERKDFSEQLEQETSHLVELFITGVVS